MYLEKDEEDCTDNNDDKILQIFDGIASYQLENCVKENCYNI